MSHEQEKPLSASEMFERMQNEGVAQYMNGMEPDTFKVSKEEIKQNAENLIRHTVELHLDNDKIPEHQKYMLVSFIDPEEVYDNKEVYCFSKFLDNFSNGLNEVFQNLEEHVPELAPKLKTLRMDTYKHLFEPALLQNTYRHFRKDNYETLKKEFYQLNQFRTSERGFKIRGCFSDMQEAQRQAKKLKELGDPFNIFVGQMGYWMPFNPPTDMVENQEYAMEELNTLMKNYKDKQIQREDDYERRKQQLREIVELQEEVKKEPETAQIEEVKEEGVSS